MYRNCIIILAVFLFFPGFSFAKSVVISMMPIYSIAHNILGDQTSISLDILSQSPDEMHGYENSLRPSDVKKLSDADLIIALDRDSESHYSDVKSTSSTIIFLTDFIEDNNDFHVWLNPEYIKIFARKIMDSLSEMDNDSSHYYQENYRRFIAEFDQLITQIKSHLISINNLKYFVVHNAYMYFTDYFNVNDPIGFFIDSDHNLVSSYEMLHHYYNTKNENICVLSEVTDKEDFMTFLPENSILFFVDILGNSYFNSGGEIRDIYFMIMNNLANALIKCSEIS